MAFPLPDHEAERLAALHALEILDSHPEAAYDDLVELAAFICGTPIAALNLIDAERQWSKALIGCEETEAPRDDSFCAHTIAEPGGELLVADALADEAWSVHPYVTPADGLRFYAGAAVVIDGLPLGALCVADTVARQLDGEQLGALRALARQASALLELRATTRRLADANERLCELAVRDPLTGLANRTRLFDRLELALAQHRRHRRPLGVVFCDLDQFKPINDCYGHHVGDETLRLVGDRLRARAREVDTVARIAGDEFVVVCPDLREPADLALVADRLAAAVGAPATVAGVAVVPSMSVGTALATVEDDPEGLLRRADDAMYAAKRRRRTNVGTLS